ncbi:hypothetical protein BURKHO8Y_70256 [Burkholderia sp. 8Y]|nr:hypothetical protein BURKHO8Y_70256 [Burkholderia sp. 8Y]
MSQSDALAPVVKIRKVRRDVFMSKKGDEGRPGYPNDTPSRASPHARPRERAVVFSSVAKTRSTLARACRYSCQNGKRSNLYAAPAAHPFEGERQ